MKRKTPDWHIWAIAIFYLMSLGGLLYLMKFVIVLPLILLILTPILCYLVYKERILGLTYKDSSGVIGLTFFIIVISVIAIFAKTYIYQSYLAEFVVDGHMVTKTITIEADEGPATWEEERTYWEPNTVKGERVISIIGWLLTGLCVGSIVACLRYYILAKEKAGEKD